MPRRRLRHDEAAYGQLAVTSRVDTPRARRTVITLGDLVSAAYRVAGTAQATARLLGAASPLGQLLDRRIVIS